MWQVSGNAAIDFPEAALQAISGLPRLQRVYVHETRISADVSVPALLKDKISF